jgi:hypothetical protein
MKHLFSVVGLVLLLGGAVSAQAEVRQDIKRIELTDAQIQDVVKVVRDTQSELEKARAEGRVVQAQLARLLLDDNPARGDLEKFVRLGQDWDFKVKMIRIDRSLKIRSIVGRDKWALLSGLSQRVLEAEKAGKPPVAPKDDDKAPLRELLGVLRDLN